ncbi:MAG: TIGR03792 family protein [Cyanothece sp. SIO1E1]|nr:TIGR03792 family protein [Cyanothece sp. SIO1E1]
MVIEWLKFKVAPEAREKFVQKDDEIWTTALAKYPGFLSKEVWISPDDPTDVSLVIRWASREQWFSIPAADLEQVEQQFNRALDGNYEMVEAREYQVRKLVRV